MTQAVILAGGFGTRLSHVIKSVPKPMAPIDNIPFLKYLYDNLISKEISSFIFLTGYKSEIIENYFKNYSNVICVKETTPLGTGGALLNAFEFLENEFYLINGDTFFDVDLSLLDTFSKDKFLTMALRYTDNVSRYGFVQLASDNSFKVDSFIEKGQLPNSQIDGYINGGIYKIKKSALSFFKSNYHYDFLSFENSILPLLIEKGVVFGLPVGGMFIDIGVPEDYYLSQTKIPLRIKQSMRPALFIDKDGTIIEDSGYSNGKKIQIINSTIDLIRKYKSKGYYLVIITNQAGIAKNKFTLDNFKENIESIKSFYKKISIEFDDVEFCPYHEDAINDNYKFFSYARKPNPGMILRACENLNIDLKNSIMIGDNDNTDIIKLPYLKSFIL